jgi:hypothetical protein
MLDNVSSGDRTVNPFVASFGVETVGVTVGGEDRLPPRWHLWPRARS